MSMLFCVHGLGEFTAPLGHAHAYGCTAHPWLSYISIDYLLKFVCMCTTDEHYLAMDLSSIFLILYNAISL